MDKKFERTQQPKKIFEDRVHLNSLMNKAKIFPAISCDVALLALYAQSDEFLSRSYNVSQIRNAVERWVQQNSMADERYLSTKEIQTFAAALQGDGFFASSLSKARQREVALDLFQSKYQENGLPICYAAVQHICGEPAKTAVWTDRSKARFNEVLEENYDGISIVEDMIVALRADDCFSSFSSKQLLPRVQDWNYRKKARAMQSRYSDDIWSEGDSDIFDHAIKAVKLDFSKFTLREWADRIAANVKGVLATKDILRRLFNMQRAQLEQEGVRLEVNEVRPGTDDIAADADWEEQRHSLVRAAADFSELKLEGPTCRCGCCGQLNFESTMTRYTNKTHASQNAGVQAILAYMTAFPRLDTRRFCCSSCIDSLSGKCMPSFCFGKKLPHNFIPDSVADLTDLEAELCSPRIAFAKIYQLRMQRQKSLRGAVINVPADYSTSQRMLPRAQSSELKVIVDLKRKLEMKANYKSGLTRPASMMEACRDLEQTPLYIKEGVEIVEPFHAEEIESDKHTAETETSFEKQVTVKDCFSKCRKHQNDDGFEIVSDDEDLYLDESEPADGSPPTETFMDLETEANELKQRVFAVAPGEGNHPLNILRDADGEELCFAKLFGGNIRSGYEGKPYFMIARHELRSADRRFAKNASNIFYKMRRMHCQTVCSSANMISESSL